MLAEHPVRGSTFTTAFPGLLLLGSAGAGQLGGVYLAGVGVCPAGVSPATLGNDTSKAIARDMS